MSSVKLSSCPVDIGNESVPKIIINNTINSFLKTAISILVISNHNSFRVLLDKIASVYFIWKRYHILALEIASPGNQHVPVVSAHFFPYFTAVLLDVLGNRHALALLVTDNSTLAASSTTSRLQGGRHGISRAAWSRATVPEWSCSCCRPARSSPTSLVIITSTACFTIPAHNRRSTHISSRCIARLELIAVWHPVIPVSARLPSTSLKKTFLSSVFSQT